VGGLRLREGAVGRRRSPCYHRGWGRSGRAAPTAMPRMGAAGPLVRVQRSPPQEQKLLQLFSSHRYTTRWTRKARGVVSTAWETMVTRVWYAARPHPLVMGRERERRSAGHHALDLVKRQARRGRDAEFGGDPPIPHPPPPQTLSQEPPQSVGGGVSEEAPGGGDGDGDG